MQEIFWLFGSIVTTFLIIALFYKPLPRAMTAKNVTATATVTVVIVTTADKRVLPALRETVEQIQRLGLSSYYVVASKPTGLPNTLIVPRERDGNKYRAIKWFVENYVEQNSWYVFFDDDSYPLDTNFLYEIPEAERRGLVAANGILVPRQGRSKVCFALDWIRFFDDLTRYRASIGVLKRPLFGLHGELLIVRGDVLREIWLTMDETITEDFVFAMNLLKRKYKTWQSTTRVSIKSPNSIKDFLNQRARWARGVILASINASTRNPLVILFMFAGIPVSMLFLALWLFVGISFVPLAFIASLYYVVVYTYGCIKAKLPPIGIFFSALEIVGVLKGLIKKQKGFIVIDKS